MHRIRRAKRTVAVRIALAALCASGASVALAAQIPWSAQQEQESVFRIPFQSQDSLRDLLKQADAQDLDVWAVHRSAALCASFSANESAVAAPLGCVDVRTTQSQVDTLTQSSQQLRSSTASSAQSVIADVQRKARAQVDEAKTMRRRRRQRKPRTHEEDDDLEWHSAYHDAEEISVYIHSLASRYPQLARVEVIGQTHEGRDLEVLVLGTRSDVGGEPSEDGMFRSKHTSPKLGFVIAAEQHAREWISTASILHFASTVLESASSSPRSTWAHLLERYDLSALPLANPDGYAYTWEHDRMWRKNRQPVRRRGSWGRVCTGVDLGRNWGYAFQTSSDPCSGTFPGEAAFDAVETASLSTYLSDRERNIRGFLELHSYGQLLMYPFAYSCETPVPDEEDLEELALGASRALRYPHGRLFEVGRVCEATYPMSGSAIDYVYAHPDPHLRIRWAYSLEARDTGTHGFLLPPDQIAPSGQELEAFLASALTFVDKKENP